MTHSNKYLYSFFSGVAVVLVMWAGRTIFSHSSFYSFLLWNLFLAFIPYPITAYMLKKQDMGWLKWIACFTTWLLFLPNAPYIITDLTHLHPIHHVPVWYDSVMVFTAALSGLWIGCISLMQMETIWKKRFPRINTWYFTAVVLLLCGFGIYLGRMLRFNSWDVITNPGYLAHTIAQRVIFPWEHLRTWATTLIFAAMMWVAHAQVKNLAAR